MTGSYPGHAAVRPACASYFTGQAPLCQRPGRCFFAGGPMDKNFAARKLFSPVLRLSYRQRPSPAGQSGVKSRVPGLERERNIDVTREEILTEYLVENQAGFYRLAYSVLKNTDEALDAIQTAVCRALERQGSLRDAGAVRPWFYRILMNTCTDALRQRARLIPFPEDLELPHEDPEPADDALARRVDALPPEVGTVIKLRFYEEMTLKEISQVTGQNLSTVKSRLYAGLKKLRIAMEGAEIL